MICDVIKMASSEYRNVTPDPLPLSPSGSKPRSLMETILVAKMESLNSGRPAPFLRTDSLDSCSSMGSISSMSSDVCRCDDCLLGIGDFYMAGPAEKARKKVGTLFNFIPEECRK